MYYGVGVNDRSRPTRDDIGVLRVHRLWSQMLRRCYAGGENVAKTYRFCSVSENFKNYSFFYDWCLGNEFVKFEKYQMDKDFLGFSDRLYSENNCVFIPKKLNGFLINMSVCEEFPFLGVKKEKGGRYGARIRGGEVRKYLGCFSTPQEAQDVYVEAKRDVAKSLATQYEGLVDDRVISILENFNPLDYVRVIQKQQGSTQETCNHY